MRNQEMTNKLAQAVRPIYEANKGEGMDRASYVSMLVSNLAYKERADKRMIYDCGNLTADELAAMIDYYEQLNEGERGQEYMAVCELVNAQDWD